MELKLVVPVDNRNFSTAGSRNLESALVDSSFKALLTKGDTAFVRFYERLFDAEPAFRQMFSSSVERQARKFLQSLKVIVSSLSAPEKAAPVLQ
jgi:hemoglobin-like flavoprotein